MKEKYILLKNKITGAKSIYNRQTQEKIQELDQTDLYNKLRKQILNNLYRKQKDQCARDLGLVKVKSSLGNTFYE